MDLVIFTGSLSEEELRRERAAHYDRLAQAGALDGLATARPSAQQTRRARLTGAVGLTLGLSLFGLIVYAVLS